MKLTVFGATGGIGLELVTQALDAGHHVTAYVRNAAKLNLAHAQLTSSRSIASTAGRSATCSR